MELLSNTSDTIIACSSGNNSNSAISIIRFSGLNFCPELNTFFSIDTTTLKPRYAHYCNLSFNNKIYDDVIMTFFPGPNSYNGQDILEVSVHGNRLSVDRIIRLFVDNSSIRLAEPGEFSFRALKNKKLTLNQVEGLDLLLNASSIFSLDQGFSLLSGKLKSSFLKLNESYLRHRSSLELGFDFLDDIGEEQFSEHFSSSFNDLKSIITQLYKQVSGISTNLIKPEVALFGLPNAGKSTLFNKILVDDRAIVSSTPGTTRDYISEDFLIDNNTFTLLDTAGLRETSDSIEKSGIDRAITLTKNSFYKILIINPFDFTAKDIDFFKSFQFDLIVFTHSDFEGYDASVSKVKSLFAPIGPKKVGSIEPGISAPIGPLQNGPIEPIYCNLTDHNSTLEGVNNICSQVSAKYLKLLSFDPILIERHRDTIHRLHSLFEIYSSEVELNSDLAIISSELNIVGHCISELIGIISPDDVLHNIFDNFCIGK